MLCPKCHYDNLAENSFCTRCGTPLPEAKKAPQPEAPKAKESKDEVKYYQDPKKKDKESRGCGCIMLTGIIILVLCVLYLIGEDDSFDEANSNTNQVTASETVDASAQGEGKVSDTVRIVVDGNVLMEDYRPKKRGDTLLFPAMAITRAGKDAISAGFNGDGIVDNGYTEVSNKFGTTAYTMNALDYFPEYGIMEGNHEPFNSCYRLKTQPIVEDGEVYTDLETIYVITAMDCDYDEAAGVLNLTYNPANADKIYNDMFGGSDTDLWIYIPYPDGGDSMDSASYFGYIKQYVN